MMEAVSKVKTLADLVTPNLFQDPIYIEILKQVQDDGVNDF